MCLQSQTNGRVEMMIQALDRIREQGERKIRSIPEGERMRRLAVQSKVRALDNVRLALITCSDTFAEEIMTSWTWF